MSLYLLDHSFSTTCAGNWLEWRLGSARKHVLGAAAVEDLSRIVWIDRHFLYQRVIRVNTSVSVCVCVCVCLSLEVCLQNLGSLTTPKSEIVHRADQPLQGLSQGHAGLATLQSTCDVFGFAGFLLTIRFDYIRLSILQQIFHKFILYLPIIFNIWLRYFDGK